MSDSPPDDSVEQPEFITEVRYETLCDMEFEPYTIEISEDVTYTKKSGHSMGSSRTRAVHETRLALTSHEGAVKFASPDFFEISVAGRKPIILSRLRD